jgi:hypothetical protein
MRAFRNRRVQVGIGPRPVAFLALPRPFAELAIKLCEHRASKDTALKAEYQEASLISTAQAGMKKTCVEKTSSSWECSAT